MNRSILQIYTENDDEAFAFYKSVFNADVGFIDTDENGNVIHQELNVNGQAIAIGKIISNKTTGSTMQFCLQYNNNQKNAVQQIYNKLVKDSKIITDYGKLIFTDVGFELVDKYGVWWCIFC